MDDDERREEGHHRSDRQSRQIGGDKLLARLPEVPDRGAKDRRNREEEGELGRSLARKPEDEAADDRSARAARRRP